MVMAAIAPALVVAPKLRAALDLDPNGHPRFVKAGDLRHYSVRLWIDDAPASTYAVTYKLDPTYYESIREARDRTSNFAEEISSLGDFAVLAVVRTRSGPIDVAIPLSRLLQETHGASGTLTEPIAAAIADIRAN